MKMMLFLERHLTFSLFYSEIEWLNYRKLIISNPMVWKNVSINVLHFNLSILMHIYSFINHNIIIYTQVLSLFFLLIYYFLVSFNHLLDKFSLSLLCDYIFPCLLNLYVVLLYLLHHQEKLYLLRHY